MMRMKTRPYTTLLILMAGMLLFGSCFRSGTAGSIALGSQDSVIQSASLLSMQRAPGYTLVTVGDPGRVGSCTATCWYRVTLCCPTTCLREPWCEHLLPERWYIPRYTRA